MNETTQPNIGRVPVKDRASLEPFFSPKGVAVIGASSKKDNLGGRIIASMQGQGYRGKITAVHPDEMHLANFHTVKTLAELPEETDLAIACLSASHIPKLVPDLAAHGMHHLIVVSGGFAETDDTGRQLQTELQDLAKQYGVRIVGPNGLGTFSAPDHFNSFFLSGNAIHYPQPGSTALISQSGAFLSVILNRLAGHGVGVHRAVNFGNRVDVGECDALEAFAQDPQVKVIGLYLEGFQNGRRFLDIAREVARRKPVIICKGGKRGTGGKAVKAHSASLAGSYEVFRSVCRQTGMIEVQGLEELILALKIFSRPVDFKGEKVLIVSNGGGMGVLLTDLCEAGPCEIKEVPMSLQKELKQHLPEYFSLRNPIDLTGSGTNEQCVRVVDRLLESGLFDCLLLVALPGTEGITWELGEKLKSVLPERFPVVVSTYGDRMFLSFEAAFGKMGIPVFRSGEEAAWALNLMLTWNKNNRCAGKFQQATSCHYDENILKNRPSGKGVLFNERQIKKILSACGVEIPEAKTIFKVEDLQIASQSLNFPLVLKVDDPDIRHKTELGAVRGPVSDPKELISAWKEMNDTWPGLVWAEEQVPAGLDLMVGMNRDPDFGPVLLLGSGGSYVELYKDIERLVLPVSNEDILKAFNRTQAGKIVQGYRSKKSLALDKLLGFANLTAGWADLEPALQSLDFNPVRLFVDRLVVLDAKIAM